jgi:hypothetical protein
MGDSDWLKDPDHPRIFIHRSFSGYPQRLKYRSLPWRGARWLRMRALRVERRFGPEDEATFWAPFARRAVRRLMRSEAPEVLIATGPPFSVNRLASSIKDEFPALRLIQDFRDPWVPDSVRDADRLRRTLCNADRVVAVTPEMTELLARSGAPRATWISNGFEAGLASPPARRGPLDCDFVHLGAIFSERLAPLNRFLGWVRDRAQDGRPVKVALIGRFPATLATEFADLVRSGSLELLPQMPQQLAFERLVRSRFALQLNAPVATTQVSTKIFEYGALRVPTVSINYGGAIVSLVEDHGLGVSVNATAADFERQLDACLERGDGDFSYDVEQFSFDHLADRYSELIDER